MENGEQTDRRAWSLLPDTRETVGLVLVAVVMVGLVIFVFQNFGVVEIDFLSWSFDLRLGWAIVIAAAAAFIPGFLLGWDWGRRR